MAKIFISYRRDDARMTAGRLHDALARHFGKKQLFMDVDNLLAGQRFDRELDSALNQCDVLLAVIGPHWMDILNQRVSGADTDPDERDYVREEIAAALARNVTVIPVLVDGAALPAKSALPDDIQDLALHQKHDITYERFGRDVDDLAAAIKIVRKARGSSTPSSFSLGRLIAGLALLLFIGGAGYTTYNGQLVQLLGTLTGRTTEQAELEAERKAERERLRKELADARKRAEDSEKQRLAMLAAQEAERKTAEAEAKSHGSEHSRNPGWFGGKIRNVTSDIAASLGLTELKGTVIEELTPNGPGDAAGLKPGDIIIDVAGTKIKDSRSFARKISSFPPGARLDVVIWRDGKQRTVAVKLGIFPGANREKHKSDADGNRRDPALSVKPGSGESFKDCDTCPEMVVVPAGSFMMGSPKGEGGRDEDEGPQREVTFAKPFAVGKFEVTWDEWDACVAGRGCDNAPVEKAGGDNGWGKGRRPIIEVDWKDAKAFASWLSKKTGKPYRLLTEAEWEYAARAGSTTRYSWGDDVGKGNANCNGCGSEWDDKQTAPVGSFKPNGFGLHDMHGNVWEWVEECYKNSYKGAPSDGTAVTSSTCERRVLRGGSWNYLPQLLRSAYRIRSRPVNRGSYIGFRIARTLTP